MLLASYVSPRNVFITQHAVLALLSKSDVPGQLACDERFLKLLTFLRPTSFFVDLFTHYENMGLTHYEARTKMPTDQFCCGGLRNDAIVVVTCCESRQTLS